MQPKMNGFLNNNWMGPEYTFSLCGVFIVLRLRNFQRREVVFGTNFKSFAGHSINLRFSN